MPIISDNYPMKGLFQCPHFAQGFFYVRFVWMNSFFSVILQKNIYYGNEGKTYTRTLSGRFRP